MLRVRKRKHSHSHAQKWKEAKEEAGLLEAAVEQEVWRGVLPSTSGK